ncbi:acyl-CoA thioesterase [Rhodobacteraceae bacterium CCMM004]|nr:acyl-CoA thioesterase [Rhodobacteraceae bacterium CCMM004]
MAFVHSVRVRFGHCDPAKLVFYPRYVEMISDTVEAFFGDALGHPFEVLHPDHAVPTVQMRLHFTAPSRLGDALEIALRPTRIGRSSLDLSFACTCGGETRFTAESTLVWVGASVRPEPWPDPLRSELISRIDPS